MRAVGHISETQPDHRDRNFPCRPPRPDRDERQACVSHLHLAHALLSAAADACPDPATLGKYQPFGQQLVDSTGKACQGAINTTADTGATAWVLASSALVLLMTPAL